MAEYIDRYEAIEALIFVMAKQSDIDSLLNVPVADVAPVVHAHWMPFENDFDDDTWVCSNCGETWTLIEGYPEDNNMRYCCKCGARMDESEGEDNV